MASGRGQSGGVSIAGMQTATSCTLASEFLQGSAAKPATNVSPAASSTDFLASVWVLVKSSYSQFLTWVSELKFKAKTSALIRYRVQSLEGGKWERIKEPQRY